MTFNVRRTQAAAAATGSPVCSGSAEVIGLVSVVIAAFNAEDYIEATCRSVLQQTYANLELAVVDDGSTDRTGGVVAALAAADPRVRLIRQSNGGVAAARNAGIAATSGEFLAVLDADDLWDPTKIERQVKRLQEAGPEAGLVYCWWAWIDEAGLVLDRSPRWRVEGHALEHLVEINFVGNTSVPLFRRSSIEAVGGYDMTLREKGAQGSEDWDLALRLAERYAIAVVPAVLVGYRRRAGGMSAASETMWRSRNLVMDAAIARNPSLSTAVTRRSDGQYRLYLAGVAFWSKRYLTALRWGLSSRPFTLLLRLLPYLARLAVLRVFPPRSSQIAFMPGVPLGDDSQLPEPLLPYDRVYTRLWKK